MSDLDAIMAEHEGSHYCLNGKWNEAFGACVPAQLAKRARIAAGQLEEVMQNLSRLRDALDGDPDWDCGDIIDEAIPMIERARDAEAKVAELRDQRETAVLYLTLALRQTHPESPTFWTDLRILAAVRSALSAAAEVPLPDDVAAALGGDHEHPKPEPVQNIYGADWEPEDVTP